MGRSIKWGEVQVWTLHSEPSSDIAKSTILRDILCVRLYCWSNYGHCPLLPNSFFLFYVFTIFCQMSLPIFLGLGIASTINIWTAILNVWNVPCPSHCWPTVHCIVLPVDMRTRPPRGAMWHVTRALAAALYCGHVSSDPFRENLKWKVEINEDTIVHKQQTQHRWWSSYKQKYHGSKARQSPHILLQILIIRLLHLFSFSF